MDKSKEQTKSKKKLEELKESYTNNEITIFTKGSLQNVVKSTRICNAFPQGTARSLYLTYPGFSRIMDDQAQRIVGLISKLIHSQQVKGDVKRKQLDEQLELVQECNDILFERINTNLDIKSGQRRGQHMLLETQINVLSSTPSGSAGNMPTTVDPNSQTNSSATPTPRAGSWNRTYINPNSTPKRSTVSLFTAKNIMRPQMQFKVPVDNSALTVFMPRIRDKPNSLKPLAVLPEYDEAGNVISYLHPYEFELNKIEPMAEQLQPKQPVLPAAASETPLCMVDSVEKLKQALDELCQAKEIAIDVEHHSYRTFMGITCLVQMSTRQKDYIFDTLVLREDMHILNLALTNPKIVKILHGADMDIEWLQRDLSLYIVNMFDTYRAAKAMNMARLSLAFLLKHYVDLDVDKAFQMADWRMRPLPQQLIDYARQDTHFLIYVYERMTNELLQLEHGRPQTLRAVYQQSTEVCKKRYIKPQTYPDSHLDMVRRSNRAFDNRQLYALRGILNWRDATARLEDESYGYVLPNHMMMQIAESLPREMQGILACCNPIPPLVRQQLHTLHQIVLRAREQPLVKPVPESNNSMLASAPAPTTKDFNSKLHRPHDFSHMEEQRDDLPTLLKRQTTGKLAAAPVIVKSQRNMAAPALSLFAKPTKPSNEDEQRWQRARDERQAMIMPYKRYLAILPLMEQLKRDQAKREHSEQLKRRLCPTAQAPEDIKLETKQDELDNMYKLPLKEQLKRKHQTKPTEAKRLKTDENTQPSTSQKHIKPEIKTEATTELSQHNGSVVEIDDGSDDDAAVEAPIERQAPAQSKRQQKQHKNKQRFKAKNKVHPQSSSHSVQLPKPEQVQNFDYKQVDFRQFRGGGQRARGTEIKQGMRGKNRPNNRNNKQFNKLFTFSNVKKDGRK